MKVRYSIVAILAVSGLLSGCNSGASFDNATTGETASGQSRARTISVVACEGKATDSYTLLQSKDEITKVSENATYRFMHDQEGEKRICAISGTIEVLRDEG